MLENLVRVGLFAAVALLVLYFGFWITPEPQFTYHPIYTEVKVYNVDLYWKLHPFKFIDGLGLTLLGIGVFVILGVYRVFTGDIYASKYEATRIYVAAAAIAALGAGLVYA